MRKCVLLCSLVVFLQSANAQFFDEVLSNYTSLLTPEKAYLHLDKSAYTPGETIWFKAYVLDDIFPAENSKTMYVDWIGSNGDVLAHSTSPIVSGMSNGQLEIPASYKGTFLHIRAYTKWMLNFDTAFIYNRTIRIIQPSGNVRALPAIQATLQLFPEGGELIAGVSNRVAFRAHDQWGRPAAIKGVVLNGNQEVVDSLRPLHNGMGSFFLIPAANMNYSVRWKDEKGTEHTTPLPAAKSTGIAMQVTINRTRRIISLQGSAELPGDLTQLHLVGTMNGKKAFQNDITMSAGKGVQRLIPTEALPTGILTFTVFDAKWNAVAERISFVNNHEYDFEPQMEVVHWGLGARKKNEIEIRIPDSIRGANFSISVTDVAIEKDTTENIFSQLLLSADIKGKVYQPAYYFTGADENRAHHLDLVMLTHGWRRFKWEEVTSGIVPKIRYPRDSTYLAFSGQLFGLSRTALSGGESIVLFIKQKDSSAKMTIMGVDRTGRFGDLSMVFFDTLQVYYSLKSKGFVGAEPRFMTDRLPTPDYSTFSKSFLPTYIAPDTTGSAYHAFLEAEKLRLARISQGKVLETIVIKTKQKTPEQLLEERYPSGLFKGGEGYQFDMVNNPQAGGYPNIFYFLQSRVAGLQISFTNSTGAPSLVWRGSTPALFLDEFETDANMLGTVPVNDIAYVKVFRPPFFGATGGGSGGAIAIYTKKGDDARTGTNKGLSSHTVFGYTPIREFYSPNYERLDKRHEEKDLRTTLYWNPMVAQQPGKNSIRVQFHNNDVTKAFRVVIEGMTPDGRLAHIEQVME